MSAPRERSAEPHGGPRAGMRRTAWWMLAVVLAALPLAAIAVRGDAAAAQTSVAPVLSCSGGMVLDSASGTCLTQRTETALRPSWCPAGATKVSGQYGGHVCQTKVTRTVDTGRTRQVYSHTTYNNAWISTGTETVQTGTNRVWVPARTMIEPLVPPVRVQVGTRTESRTVTRPGPDVLYEVSYEVQVQIQRVVQRCAFDPFAGQQCWNVTVTETRTETRTRLECCIPGPPITETVTTEVPVYEWRTTHTATIPGYWREDPVYETRETGYWDRVPTIHYTTERIYETVVQWVTSPVTLGSCTAGWQAVGSQCRRTVLGQPSAAPTHSCPAGSVPRYGDSLGGTGPSALTCQSSAPGSGTDTGTSQDDSGGSPTSPDGDARPLHHLAGESDERLAELGIHRCADGLLSYVSCDELPRRTWDSDPDICDGIEGTTYRPDHGGSCVTESDLLSKCTTPGDCEETTIRTYCPAIGELADTQIQEHAHPDRGAETYRVCIFDCSSFGTLPPYVRSRIHGSYDYACLPTPEDEPSATTTSTTAPTSTTTTTSTTVPDEDDEDDEEDDEGDEDEGDEDEGDEDGPDDTTRPDTSRPDVTVVTTRPTSTTAAPPGSECAPVPSAAVAAGALGALSWRSHVPAASTERSQQHLPGGGRYLQVAPGRGWAEIGGPVEVSEHGCRWIATWVRVSWAEQRPWKHAERRAMETGTDTEHLVARWDALSADRQKLVEQWHRRAVPAVVCTVADASGQGASASCGWLLKHPAAYAWLAAMCFEPETPSDTPGSVQRHGSRPAAGDPCWVPLASGVDWIRSVSDYADGRVTLQSGSAS